jgi:1,4-dihydroxy-2-naphthoate octaprenyltransferase
VLTITFVGIAAYSALAGGGGSKAGRRLLSAVTMLAGALVGAVLIRQAQAWCPLLIAWVVIIAGAAATYTLGKQDPAWVRAPGKPSR